MNLFVVVGGLVSKNVSTVIMSLSVWRTAKEQFGRRHQNVSGVMCDALLKKKPIQRPR
jgi:hypothetical protein